MTVYTIMKLATILGAKNEQTIGRIKASQVSAPGIISKNLQSLCFLIRWAFCMAALVSL